MSIVIKYFDEPKGKWADITGTPGSTLRLDASGWTADNSLDDVITDAYAEMGNDIKSVSLTINTLSEIVTDGELVSDVVYLSAFYVVRNTTITGVKWFQTLQGAYTGVSYNGVGIYSGTGTTLTKIIDSNNDTELWKGSADTWRKKAFKNPVLLSKGYHYIAWMFRCTGLTTAPRIGSGNWSYSPNINKGDFTSSRILLGQYINQASLPDTINLSSNITHNYSQIPFGVWAY